jgi:signal transduction histidine kinase
MSEAGWAWYPRRIAGQITIVVVCSIGLALAMVVAIIILTRPKADPQNVSRAVDAFLGVVRLLDATPDQQRRDDILQAAAAAFPQLHIAPILASGREADRDTEDRYTQFLNQALGPGFTVYRPAADAAAAGRRAAVVRIASAHGVTVQATVPDLARPPPLTPIVTGALIFVTASVSLLLLWATKALTAPLSRFADAADQFGRDFEHRTLPDQGPEEVRKASRAFNQMGERIKRLVEDRTNMLAAISHDLRTPITRLRLRAEFIEDEAIRAYMLSDLERLNSMIHAALAFIRDSRTEDAAIKFDLAALLRAVCKQFAGTGKDVCYRGAEREQVVARPDSLQRAVTNLVENALKFGTKAVIELHEVADGGLAIDVIDDGPGLGEADPQWLLRPFIRGDNARTQNRNSGFGLGLTIANAIIEAHGGRLTLRNREPGGLTARLTLGSDCRAEYRLAAGPPAGLERV